MGCPLVVERANRLRSNRFRLRRSERWNSFTSTFREYLRMGPRWLGKRKHVEEGDSVYASTETSQECEGWMEMASVDANGDGDNAMYWAMKSGGAMTFQTGWRWYEKWNSERPTKWGAAEGDQTYTLSDL